jgi:ABC-type multidrug transport system fused ATPase/permease subunit
MQLLQLPPDTTLDTALGGGARGSTGLSAGQRQLLTLGRTLLRDVNILIMDEPTSNIDAETDARIQSTLIRERMRGVTVITIAHRLQTIVGYDKVLVMEQGRLVEQGTPHELLMDPSSHFFSMASELGSTEVAALRAKAARESNGGSTPSVCV